MEDGGQDMDEYGWLTLSGRGRWVEDVEWDEDGTRTVVCRWEFMVSYKPGGRWRTVDKTWTRTGG